MGLAVKELRNKDVSEECKYMAALKGTILSLVGKEEEAREGRRLLELALSTAGGEPCEWAAFPLSVVLFEGIGGSEDRARASELAASCVEPQGLGKLKPIGFASYFDLKSRFNKIRSNPGPSQSPDRVQSATASGASPASGSAPVVLSQNGSGSLSPAVAPPALVPAQTLTFPQQVNENPTLEHWCNQIAQSGAPSSRASAFERLESRHLRQILVSLVDAAAHAHAIGRSIAAATPLVARIKPITHMAEFVLPRLPEVDTLDRPAEIERLKRLIAFALLGGDWSATVESTPLPDLATKLEAAFWLEAADLITETFPSLEQLKNHPFFWKLSRTEGILFEFGEEMTKLTRPSSDRDNLNDTAAGLVRAPCRDALDWSCLPPALLRHLGYSPPKEEELAKIQGPWAGSGASPAQNFFNKSFNCHVVHAGSACPLREHIDAFQTIFQSPCPPNHTCNQADPALCTKKCVVTAPNCRPPPWPFTSLCEQIRHGITHASGWNNFSPSDVADLKALLDLQPSETITGESLVKWLVWPASGAPLPPYLARGEYLMLIVRLLRWIQNQPLDSKFAASLTKLKKID